MAKLFNRDRSNISLKEKRPGSASTTPRQDKIERTDSVKAYESGVSDCIFTKALI